MAFFAHSGSATILSSLNLKSNHIGDMGLMALSSSVNPASSLQTLNVDENRVSPAGGMALASMVSQGRSLKNISMGKNMLGPAVGMAMAQALGSNFSLGKIQLPDTGQDVRTAMAFAQVAATAPHVNYFDNNAIPLDPVTLPTILDTLKNAPNLTDLTLSNSNLDDRGASQVAMMLSVNYTITTADLSNNNIGNMGANALAGMVKSNRFLQILNVSANKITDPGAMALAAAATNSLTLKKLDLTGCTLTPMGKMALRQAQQLNPGVEIIFDEDVPMLITPPGTLPGYPQALPPNLMTTKTWNLNKLKVGPLLPTLIGNAISRMPTQVENLQVAENAIGDQGAVTLVSMLSQYANVATLDLSNNNITAASAGAIAAFITRNPNLEQLDLSDNSLGVMGITLIAKAIAQHPRLKSLQLNGTGCGDGGAAALTSILPFNGTLTSLSLENNQIGDMGASAFAKGLIDNGTLSDLNLANNQIGPAGASALGALFAKGSPSTLMSQASSSLLNRATVSAPNESSFDAPLSTGVFTGELPPSFISRAPSLQFADSGRNITMGRFQGNEYTPTFASKERLSALSKAGFSQPPPLEGTLTPSQVQPFVSPYSSSNGSSGNWTMGTPEGSKNLAAVQSFFQGPTASTFVPSTQSGIARSRNLESSVNGTGLSASNSWDMASSAVGTATSSLSNTSGLTDTLRTIAGF